jgi:hypothetical protein
MSEIILIDRKPVVQEFLNLLGSSKGKRILRITGAEKMGKSRLLREFRNISQESSNSHCTLVDLKSKFQNYGDVIFQITQQLTVLEFKNVVEVQQEMPSPAKIEMNKLNLLLSRISVNLLNDQNDTIDSQKRQKLTSAFCRDLKDAQITKPILLQFDSFDCASPKIQDWLNEQLISSLVQIPMVYIILAGRTLPDFPTILEGICDSYVLLPVTLEDHISYCEKLGINISEEVIKAFHDAFNGTPGLFAEYTSRLEKKN